MSDMKIHCFKLFGKNIQLSTNDIEVNSRVDQGCKDYNHDYDDNDCDFACIISSNDNSKQDEFRALNEKTFTTNTNHEGQQPNIKNGSHSTITDDSKTASNDKEYSSQDSHNNNFTDPTSNVNQQNQKPLKKPDKILPCPRCNSMSTKFCYFNNYNVNQPRHFCRDCQRYWTAGGTMRTVPVGSGRRKNKNSCGSQNRHQLFQQGSEFTASYTPFGFVQENAKSKSMFQCFPPQVPYVLNPMGLEPGFYSGYNLAGNRNLQSDQSRKHSRDGTMMFFTKSDFDSVNATEEKNSEIARFVRAKTTKVDDPIKAANSSIWTTLQNKNKHNLSTSPITKTGFFGLHQSNNYPNVESLPVFSEFNPAAMSRSLLFQEIR